MNYCAGALKQAGIEKVWFLTLCTGGVFKEKRRGCVHIATVIQSKTVSYIHFLMEKLLPFDSHKAYNRRQNTTVKKVDINGCRNERKLSAVSPEEVETDTVKQEYGERMKKENGFENFKGNDPKIRHIRNLVSVLPGQIFLY